MGGPGGQGFREKLFVVLFGFCCIFIIKYFDICLGVTI
jgi:hypothetical protein